MPILNRKFFNSERNHLTVNSLFLERGNKRTKFLKLNKFDQFYKKKVANLIPWTFEHW